MTKNEPVLKNKTIHRRAQNSPLRHPAWNLWQGLLVILFVNIIEWPLGWLQTPANLDTLKDFLRFNGVGFGETFLYLFGVYILLRILGKNFSDVGFRRCRLAFLFLGAFMGLFLFLSVGFLGTILTRLLGTPAPQSFAEAVNGNNSSLGFILLLILGGVAAPLKEEVIFRGIIYPPLRQSYGKGKAILYTGIFFAALHLDLVRFLPLFIGGIILTWLYERTESLWPSIIAHGTWNTLMALALWIQK